MLLEFHSDCTEASKRAQGHHVSVPGFIRKATSEGWKHLGSSHNFKYANYRGLNPNCFEAVGDASEADFGATSGAGAAETNTGCWTAEATWPSSFKTLRLEKWRSLFVEVNHSRTSSTTSSE